MHVFARFRRKGLQKKGNYHSRWTLLSLGKRGFAWESDKGGNRVLSVLPMDALFQEGDFKVF